jgi:hypothetical protein|tara:strand:+ start:522 stop:692 length:171 start_codon:yes stop_codon:yes gene_type:complete
MRAKIYERNPDTGQIRWRYVDESHDKFGWPNYGRILKQKTETWIEGYRKWKKKMSQ